MSIETGKIINANAPKVRREFLSGQIANALRRMILSGEIATGAHLAEDKLASQFGCSRTPLREALRELRREGLVSARPGRGTYVTGLNCERLRAVSAVRTVLEVFAAELAASRITPLDSQKLMSLVDALRDAIERGQPFAIEDIAIHRMIWRLSGNDCLMETLKSLVAPIQALVQLNADSYQDWEQVVAWHRELVDAIVSGDPAQAAAAMREHQATALRKALAALEYQTAQYVAEKGGAIA